MEEFYVRLNKAFANSGLKQADIVERTGIGKSALSSYFSGKYKPKQENTYKLAQILNVSEAWLMGLDVPMERNSTTNNMPFSFNEIELIKKYRQLDADGKRAVDDMIDFKLFQQSQKDSSTENKVG